MSYDNKTNRELAKTALAIYAKHSVPQNDGRSNCNISSLNENVNYNSAPQRTPQTLKEAISDILLEFSSDVVLLSEHSIGRQLNSNEINNVAGRLLEYINILPPKQQVSLMQELTTLYEGDYFNIPTADAGNNVYDTAATQYLPHRPLVNQGQLSAAGRPTSTLTTPGPQLGGDIYAAHGKTQPGFGAGGPTSTAATNQAPTGGGITPYDDRGIQRLPGSSRPLAREAAATLAGRRKRG